MNDMLTKARELLRVHALAREVGTPRMDEAIAAREGDTIAAMAERLGMLAFDLERECVKERIRREQLEGNHNRLVKLLEDRCDTVDGNNGEPRANQAMSILAEWQGRL